MMTHIVLWKLKTSANGQSKEENAREAKSRLEALINQIPSLIDLNVGIDISQTDQSADLSLYTTFNDKTGLELYKNHPSHLAVIPFIMSITSERSVCDYEG